MVSYGVSRRVATLWAKISSVLLYLLLFSRYSGKCGRKVVKMHVGCRFQGNLSRCDPWGKNFVCLDLRRRVLGLGPFA